MDRASRLIVAKLLRIAARTLAEKPAHLPIDYGEYEDKLFEYLQDLFSESGVSIPDAKAKQHPNAVRDEDGVLKDKDPDVIYDVARRETARIMIDTAGLAERNVDRILRAIDDLPNWGSHVSVKLLWKNKIEKGITHTFFPTDPIGDLQVFVHSAPKVGRDDPSFTLFEDGPAEDVLDVGDRDFFNDSQVEQDYFALVNEIRDPGSSMRKAKKKLTLYTARPVHDRRIYDTLMKKKEVHSGIFLANTYEHMSGLAYDLSGGEGRDIYRVVMHAGDVVETNRNGSYREYQAIATENGFVPVIEMTRIRENEGTELQRKKAA